MPYEFKLPDLGEGIAEAELRKWLVKEGENVAEHQNILEVETDKAVVEVPAPKAGAVLKIYKKEGDVARVGETLLEIGAPGEAAAPAEKAEAAPVFWEGFQPEGAGLPAGKEGAGPPVKKRESVSVIGELPEAEAPELLITPAARALMREKGIGMDRLGKIRGTGPGGAITEKDLDQIYKILAGKEKKKEEDEFGPVERLPLRGLRKTIAKNLLKSQQATVFVTGMEEADITELWELREREKAPLKEKGVHLTFMPFLVKAAWHAVKEHPYMNASLDEEQGEIVLKKYFNTGIAVDTPEGLMVPVIKDAGKKTVIELAAELQELAERARQRRLSLEELKGGTFTITNYGHFGGTFATPVINYPECAILGTGRIMDKPWVRAGRIEIRKIIHLSLTFDHRITDGADASRFLGKVVRYIEDPALIFIESS